MRSSLFRPAAALLLSSVLATAANPLPLDNGALRAEFDVHGLTSITDLRSAATVHLTNEGASLQTGDRLMESEEAATVSGESTPTTRTYHFLSGAVTWEAIYELRPGWHFISKQLHITALPATFHAGRIEVFRGRLDEPVGSEHRLRDGALLRFAPNAATMRKETMFALVQNPFARWSRTGARVSLSYQADLDWLPTDGPFYSDRVCLGLQSLTGKEVPDAAVPEWKYLPGGEPPAGPGLDRAEIDSLTDCVRAFLLVHPKTSSRIHVGWCENDYQIDAATPEGRTEYRRIIDGAAALGCRDVLYAPANSTLSSLAENKDAWAWENSLWFGLGQKIRKGEWAPGRDAVPDSVQEMLTYAGSKDVQLVACVYPSLPFLQDPRWTKWNTKFPLGGYLGADTGDRGFQDWLLTSLVNFQKATGAGGFSFDHWWIAYEDGATSKYAQWAGCRRVLERLRAELPEAVIDGRQQYHSFGVWSWLAGTYPHPLAGDEQPQSFRAFPDLHLDRVTADRQRSSVWWYRIHNFCPPEIMPGFIGHQTPRMDEHNTTRRDRFRARDWDTLGWRYSLLSSIATAPFNHVVNMIPARDAEEFASFTPEDQKYFRGWLDWADEHLDVLRHVRPIMGQPMLGRVDGTAAFDEAHGFVFLFNPNYRALPAEFTLDDSIGLTASGDFLLRQLYPEEGKGRLLTSAAGAFFAHGEHVSIPMPGTEALVLEVVPAPKHIDVPLLIGGAGKAALHDGALDLTEVTGEPGTQGELRVLLPGDEPVHTLSVNGAPVPFTQAGALVTFQVRFAGQPFVRSQPVGSYDSSFAGGKFTGARSIPSRVFQQLAARRKQWPVAYTAEEREATWLANDRLLLFINIAEPSDKLEVQLKIDGQSDRPQARLHQHPAPGGGEYLCRLVCGCLDPGAGRRASLRG